MSEEETITHDGPNRAHKICKCCDCGVVRVCTPQFDFYGKDGGPLRCETCMMKHHGLADKPLMHAIPATDGSKIQVSKEQFVEFVEKTEKQDWYFTFGHGQPHFGCYTVIHGTCASACEEMNRRYGRVWFMQYASAEEAGVEKWHLERLP